MDLFEKINRSFGGWYEGLFGGGDDVRPKDILRRILAAMEDHRKEGFDNKVYVPNQYILEINVHDEEEKEYLLSFLDRDELEAAIRRYCQQNHYHIRGPLDFTIKEVEDPDLSNNKRGEKVQVRCRYNTKITGPETPQPDANPPRMVSAGISLPEILVEERTVASAFANAEESGTVPSIAAATLVVYAPDRAPFRYAIARGSVNIGRSAKIGNDMVIESDGQISKRHARIELDPDGRFTLYDLESTNGVKVNGRRVDNRTLNDGDEIVVGTTRITFLKPESSAVAYHAMEGSVDSLENRGMAPVRAPGAFGGAVAELNRQQESGSSSPPSRVLRNLHSRLILIDGTQRVDDFLLASETSIGRGVTNDIVLPDRSVATRHARLLHDGTAYTVENVANSGANALLNGLLLPFGKPMPLKHGDILTLGNLTLRFEDEDQ